MGRKPKRGSRKNKKPDKGNAKEKQQATPSNNEATLAKSEAVSGSEHEEPESPKAPERVESLDHQQPSTSTTPDLRPQESQKPSDDVMNRMMKQLEFAQQVVQYQNRQQGQNRRHKNRRDDRPRRQSRERLPATPRQQHVQAIRAFSRSVRSYVPQPPAKDYPPDSSCRCKECTTWTKLQQKPEGRPTSSEHRKQETDSPRSNNEASNSNRNQGSRSNGSGENSMHGTLEERFSFHPPPNYAKLPQPPFPRAVIRSPIHPHVPGGMAVTFEEQKSNPSAGKKVTVGPGHQLKSSSDRDPTSLPESSPTRVPDPKKHVCNIKPQPETQDPVRAFAEDIVAVEYRKSMTTFEYLSRLRKTESQALAKINDPACPNHLRLAFKVTHMCIGDKIKQNSKLLGYTERIQTLLREAKRVQDSPQQKQFTDIHKIVTALERTCICSDGLGNSLLEYVEKFAEALKQGIKLNTDEVKSLVKQIRICVLLINREPTTPPEEILEKQCKELEKSVHEATPQPFSGDSCVRPKTVTDNPEASTSFQVNNPEFDFDEGQSDESNSESEEKSSPEEEREDVLTTDSLIGFVQTCQRLMSTLPEPLEIMPDSQIIDSSAMASVESGSTECLDSNSKLEEQSKDQSHEKLLGAEASIGYSTENTIGVEELYLKFPPSEFTRPCCQLFGPFGPWKHRREKINSEDQYCKNCKEPFRWPHILSCFHVFCFPCIAKMYVKEKDCVQCSNCSRPTPTTDAGPDSLDIDIGKCRLMLLVDKCPFACTCCSVKTFASLYCKTCMAYLCTDGEQLHRNTPELRAHDFHKITKVGIEEGMPCATCPKHPGMIMKKVCRPCWSPICPHCEYTSHKDHEICSLDQVAKECNERIRKYSSFYAMFRDEIQSNLQFLNLQKQNVDTAFKDKRNEVSRYHSALRGWIDDCSRKASGILNQTTSMLFKKLKKDEEDLIAYQQDVLTLNEFTERAMELGRDGYSEELASLYGIILKKWNELDEKYKELGLGNPNYSVDIKFEPSFPAINRVLEDNFGSLRINVNTNYDKLHKLSRGQERVDIEPIQPLPYGLDHIFDEDTRPRDGAPSGASACTDADAQEAQLSFIRVTVPYSRAFGQYGRGDYEFAEPSGVLYMSGGRLAVCDSRNHRIVIYNPDGTYRNTYGMPPNLPPLADANSQDNTDRPFQRTFSKLYFPFRMAECPRTGAIVVLERPPSLDIQVFTREGEFLRSFGNSDLRYPRGITVDENGLILVVESRTMKLFMFTMQGQKTQTNRLSLHLEFPNDIAARNRRIYISDNRAHCVHIFNYSLERLGSIGNESLTYFPIGVSFNHLNQLVVTDNHNTFNITVFNTDGTFLYGLKSRSKHANCYNVALHPARAELAVTTRECKVLIFNYQQPEGQTLSVNNMPM